MKPDAKSQERDVAKYSSKHRSGAGSVGRRKHSRACSVNMPTDDGAAAPPPSLLQRLLHWLILQYIHPSDEYDSAVRKVSVFILGGIGGVGCACFCAWFLYRHIARVQEMPHWAYTGELQTAMAYGVFPIFFGWPAYLMLRATGDVSPSVATWAFLGGMGVVLFGLFGTLAISSEVNAVCVGIVGLAAKAGTVPDVLMMAGAHLVLLFAALRFAWPATFMVPNPHAPTPAEYFLLLLVAHFALFLVELHALMSRRAFNDKIEQVSEMNRQASATAKLATRVSKKLARYDTKAARRLLSRYQEHAYHDADVAEQFAALLRNLERYRPHLPTWVLPEAADDDAAKGDEMAAEDDEVEDFFDDDEIDEGALLSTGHDEDGTRSVRSNRSRKSHGRGGDDDSAHLSHSLTSLGTTQSPMAPAHGWGARGAVAVAHVRFALTDGSDDALRQVLEQIQRCVHDTRGVVHACVSSTLTVSWGAAVSTGRPELAAARCFARIKHLCETFADGKTLVAAGAAYTGPAVVRLSGDARHQLLAIETPAWAGALDRMFALAIRHGAFFVTTADAKSIPEIVSQQVTLIAPERASVTADSTDGAPSLLRGFPGPGDGLRVSEVLAEHKVNEDEWMYQLQQLEAKAAVDDPVTTAAKLCEAGRFDDAAALLGKAAAPPATPDATLAAAGATSKAARSMQRLAATCHDHKRTVAEFLFRMEHGEPP